MNQPSPIGAHRFGHTAMNTEFEILAVYPDREYARQAALVAFDLLDRMEAELSRFISNSDISRLNRLAPGQSARVSRWTMECLLIAREIHRQTGGAFDISLGTGLDALALDPTESRAGVRGARSGLKLDLGGIGKGYAVDRMAEVLAEWEIPQALLHGGHSSVLALDAPDGREGWPLTIGERTVQACRRAFGASGLRVQGRHIINPRTGGPVEETGGVCVSIGLDAGPSPAALAEAYSTGFMILSDREAEAIRSQHPGLYMEHWRTYETAITNSDA